MSQTETKELYERLENVKKTNSNSKQTDFQENADFIKEKQRRRLLK